MRKLLLKVLGEEDKDQIDYAKVFRVIAESPADKAQGISPDEMIKTGRIITALDAAEEDGEGELILEDADYSLFLNKFNTTRWGRYNKHLEELITDVRQAQAFKAGAKEESK